MKPSNRTVYALVWYHSDSSGGGILRIYSDEEAAKRDMNVMLPVSHAVLSVMPAPMIDEGGE